MELGSIFLILALLLLVAFFVSRPFFEKTPAVRGSQNSSDHDLSALLAEHDRILNALQELDFDYGLGKIPEEDYPQQRSTLVLRGANILKQLDTLQPGENSAGLPSEQRIEVAVAARRADAGVARSVMGNGHRPTLTGSQPDDELEVMLANRRRVRQEKAAGFCAQCGGPLQKSDQFCPKCGAKI